MNFETKVFSVNEVHVDPQSYLVSREGISEKISPRSLHILQYLIHKQGKLVTFEELSKHIWQAPTTESALYQQITNLRKALGDAPHSPRFIKTVPKQGYRFIGQFNEINSVKKSLSLKPLAIKKHLINTINALFLIINILLVSYFYEPITSKIKTSIHTFSKLPANLSYPKNTIALQVSDKSNLKYSGLLQSMELIIKYHLDQDLNQHVIKIPKFQNRSYHQKLEQHFSKNGNIDYIFIPTTIDQGQNNITLELIITDPTHEKIIEKISTTISKKHIETGLPIFEQTLVNKLIHISLVDKSQKPLFNNNNEANKLIISSATTLAAAQTNLTELKKAIIDTKKAISLNPKNLMAYSILWKEILFLMKTDSEFNVNSILDTLRFYSEQAIKINPNHHESYFANAEYYCWIQNYDECSKKIDLAIQKTPYSPDTLMTLSWNLKLNKQSSLTVDKINYDINPFSKNVYNYYLNALIHEKHFAEVAELINMHSS